ncbi:MAG: chemotaxis protein CheX [Deferrisomatales bacterium]
MRAEHVNAFVVPSVQVLQKMARTEVRLGRVARVLGDSRVDDNLSIIIGLHGPLSGAVLLTAAREVAAALAGRISGQVLGAADEAEVRAVLSEVANTIAGNAAGELYSLGIRVDISPPTVVAGPEVEFDFGENLESVLVPLETGVGRVDVIVSLNKETP